MKGYGIVLSIDLAIDGCFKLDWNQGEDGGEEVRDDQLPGVIIGRYFQQTHRLAAFNLPRLL